MFKETANRSFEGSTQDSASGARETSEKRELLYKRPVRGFATVEFADDGSFNIGVVNHVGKAKGVHNGSMQELPGALRKLAREAGVKKLVAAAVVKDEHADPDQDYKQKSEAIDVLADQHDIAPLFMSRSQVKDRLEEKKSTEDPMYAISRLVSERFNFYGSEKVEPDPTTRRVHAMETVTLQASERQYPQKFWQESMTVIDQSAKELDDSIVVRINTTAKAGGVAGMNIPMDAWIKGYNANENRKLKKGEEGHPIDFRWYVLDKEVDPEIAVEFGVDLKDPELMARYEDPKRPGKLDIFRLTKKRHNLAQGVAKPHEDYDELDDRFYQAWGKSQYVNKLQELRHLLQDSKDNPQGKKLKIILDDQQPAVLNQYIHAENPEASQIFRSHIQYTDGPKAKKIADHVIKDLTGPGRKIDAFISHRSRDEEIDAFLPKGPDGQVDARIADITMYKVATADQLGELERKLGSPEDNYELGRPYLQDINVYLQETGQKPITKKDVEAGFVGQFARHDPAKNHEGAVEAAVLRIDRMHKAGVPLDEIPGQIIAGFGATDDPDGEWVEAKIRSLVKDKHLQLKDSVPTLMDKIKIFRFDYNQFSGHHMNVLQRMCVLGEQLSHAEGCEDKITQLLQMNIPVLVADRGGMPPQIVDGKTGIKIKDQKDHEAIADIQFKLLHERWMKQQYPEMIPGKTKLEEMSENTKTMVNLEYTTLANVRDIVGLAAVMNKKDQIPSIVREQREAKNGQFPYVKDVVFADLNRTEKQEHKIPQQGLVFSAV